MCGCNGKAPKAKSVYTGGKAVDANARAAKKAVKKAAAKKAASSRVAKKK